jgi:DNA-binding NarL/FixJ family response regulator
MRAGFRLILERQPGIEVAGEAASGAEAVTLARRLAPDVVLMDIRMPDLDGIQATRLIRADPATADTRVIILTTFDRVQAVVFAYQHGLVPARPSPAG